MSEEKVWFKSWPKGVGKNLEYPSKSVHKMFEEVVEKNPDLTYLSVMGNDYSYSGINESASKFASALIKLGVTKGDRVGIFMPNIPQFVIAFFGILKIGATVVPISPLYGTEDILNTITDSNIKAIVGLDFLYPSVIEACKNSKEPEIVILTSLVDLVSPILGFIAKLVGKIPKAPKIPHALKFYDLINPHEPLKESVIVDPNNTTDVSIDVRSGNGVLGNPSIINRGVGCYVFHNCSVIDKVVKPSSIFCCKIVAFRWFFVNAQIFK